MATKNSTQRTHGHVSIPAFFGASVCVACDDPAGGVAKFSVDLYGCWSPRLPRRLVEANTKVCNHDTTPRAPHHRLNVDILGPAGPALDSVALLLLPI